MAEAGPGAAGGYVAFISYSHKDALVGRWLHRKLESYRLPKRLVGTAGDDGAVPARLIPIFRDREELPAAGDLSEKVRAALAASHNLIVVCSPHSAASPWVAKEIETFRELHPDRPIFTAIVEGEPGECFAPALRKGGVEPLAADLRKEGDGRRLGLLKLVAGLAGVGLDQLVQRDAARRIRRVTYVTAAAVAAMLVMAFLTIFALDARAEAQRQRAQAEGMVEFMLTDLRTKLKGVTGLSVLTAVNQRALAYYRDQDLSGLPAESLERRARILHAMGEDDMRRDDLVAALQRFEEAGETTSRLLAEDPSDEDRIYAHAQSEFWIGHVANRRHRFADARRAFQHYKILAEKLIAAAPTNPKWRGELGYAEGNLCTVELDSGGDPDVALKSCTASLLNIKRAAQESGDPEWVAALANRYAWLADVYRLRGDTHRAEQLRSQTDAVLKGMLASDPGNLELTERWANNQSSIAELEVARGAKRSARKRLQGVLAVSNGMIRADPSNREWAIRRERVQQDLARVM